MTYCVALALAGGLVMLSDTRTNAGVDRIATFGKLFVTERPGDRVIAMMTSGNLAVTQSVMALLEEGVELDGEVHTLTTVENLFRAARLVGTALRQVHKSDGPALEEHGIGFDASIVLGGQIGTERPRLFQIYAAGNFIEATADTPFLQLGEHKYGKPILDRVARRELSVEEGVKLALISMDSTLRSNLGVGMPLDLLVYRTGALTVGMQRRIDEHDTVFRAIHNGWSGALRVAFQDLPTPDWTIG
jgi:putative proteasome-type protease